jgi:hypothetical protein
MIDLIFHGLSLRKKTTEAYPQVIRSISASAASYLAIDSARSSESATISNKIQIHGVSEEFKVIPVAEVADIAEIQSRPSNVVADDVRKIGGLNAINRLAFNDNPKNSLELVTCNACNHFNPDTIGDGFGIGECYLGVKWTRQFDGRRPLYRYAERNCEKFSKLMN